MSNFASFSYELMNYNGLHSWHAPYSQLCKRKTRDLSRIMYFNL